jgi:hypothetical protein
MSQAAIRTDHLSDTNVTSRPWSLSSLCNYIFTPVRVRIHTYSYHTMRFLANFLYFEKKKLIRLCDLHSVVVSLKSPINFGMPEPVYMKLYTYITTPEPIWTAYFINPSHQSVCLCILIVARQRLGKHVSAATNTRSSTRNIGFVCSWVCLCIPLSLPGNGSVKTPPVSTKNCWRRRFLHDPCRMKGK